MTMLTRNTDILRREVAAHVAADAIVGGQYWAPADNAVGGKGCFIGCLTHGNYPQIAVDHFGLPIMVQRIAEDIFEALPRDDAKAFFSALPDAVACDGKDLSFVGWQFLDAELRAMPEQPRGVKAVIEPVIKWLKLLATGNTWPAAAARCADADADAARSAARSAYAADADADAAAYAAYAARSAAAYAAAADAADAADADARSARSARFTAAAYAARIRQRDTLLRLISEAPVVDQKEQRT